MFGASSKREMLLYRGSIERFIDTRCRLEDRKEIWKFFWDNPHIGLAVAKNYQMSNESKQNKFIELMAKPTLKVIFAGRKGSGKTALSFWIAERLHNEFDMNTCVLYPLNFRPDKLPFYFYGADHEDKIEFGDFCIMDEAQIRISSRSSNTNINKNFSQFLSIQRHKGISMFMIQQDIAMSDVNEMRLADSFIFKPSGITNIRETVNRGNALLQFLQFLRPIDNKETLFISSDHQTIILFENPLASFWSDELSTPTKDMNMTKMRDDFKAKMSGKKAPKRETEAEILKKEYG